MLSKMFARPDRLRQPASGSCWRLLGREARTMCLAWEVISGMLMRPNRRFVCIEFDLLEDGGKAVTDSSPNLETGTPSHPACRL
jgi:hypothetical protein